ncbi:MAG: hypothetical protein RJR37_00785 [Peptococcaceae bacterium MAG4]|nr:hypothetical protein [Peptococcaceae bacterium MAG4]
MSANVDRLLQEIQKLTIDEIKELLAKVAAAYDIFELMGWLKIAESAFVDWDNEEDAVYDRL